MGYILAQCKLCIFLKLCRATIWFFKSRGASIALTLSIVISTIITLAYIRKTKDYEKTWHGWSWESLTGWWNFVRLGLPGMLVNCFEWWAGEIAIIIAGTIGENDLALVSIYMNLLIFIFGVSQCRNSSGSSYATHLFGNSHSMDLLRLPLFVLAMN